MQTPVFSFRNTLALFVLLVMAPLAVGIAQGQAAKSTILGTITDATDAVVPGVDITVTNLETNVSRKAITNGTGYYILPFLDSGEYRVAAALPGFKTAVETRAVLDVNTKLRVDLTLQVGRPWKRWKFRPRPHCCRRTQPPSGGL